MFQTEYIPTVGKLHDLICTGTGVWFGNSVSHICTQVRQRCVSSCDCRVGRLHIPTTWMATWPGQEDRNSLGVASSETCETWSLTGPTPRTCLEFPFRNSHTDHTVFCLGFQFLEWYWQCSKVFPNGFKVGLTDGFTSSLLYPVLRQTKAGSSDETRKSSNPNCRKIQWLTLATVVFKGIDFISSFEISFSIL